MQQDVNNPICEGSGVIPVIELGLGCITDYDWHRAECPVCGHPFALTRPTPADRRGGRIRKHRRLA